MKLKTKSEDKWINVAQFEGSDESADFLVAFLTPKENIEMLEKHTKREWDNSQSFEKMDLYAYKIDRIIRTIKDWKDILDEDGTPLECTNKMKEMVYLFNSDLINRLLIKVDEIALKMQEGKDEEIKNLLLGSNGAPT